MDRGGAGFAQAMHPLHAAHGQGWRRARPGHAPSTCTLHTHPPHAAYGQGWRGARPGPGHAPSTCTLHTQPTDRGGAGLTQATHPPHTARLAARDNGDTVQQREDLKPVSDPSFEDRSGLTLVSGTVSGPTLNESAILLKYQIPEMNYFIDVTYLKSFMKERRTLENY